MKLTGHQFCRAATLAKLKKLPLEEAAKRVLDADARK